MKIINSEPLLPLLNSLPSLGLAKLIGLTGLSLVPQIETIASQTAPWADVIEGKPRKTDKLEAPNGSFQLYEGDIIAAVTAVAIGAVGMGMSDNSLNITPLYILTSYREIFKNLYNLKNICLF